MIEANNPVDITKADILRYKEKVEDLFTDYSFRNETVSLPELIRGLDPREKHVMSDLERDTYLAIREGCQIFKAVSNLLSEKVGLKKKIIQTSSSNLSDNLEINKLRRFCYNYATFASSLYISKKMEKIISVHGQEDDGYKNPDLDILSLAFDMPENSVIKRLMAPLFARLKDHALKGAFFNTADEFPMYTKGIYDKYVELTLIEKRKHPDLLEHLTGYQFRIMDDFLVLDEYNNKSIIHIEAQKQAVSFQPVTEKEIVGNRAAKKKLKRYVERLVLYDTQKQMNPVLELGGLSWSILFDGLPGTGKTSLFRYVMTRLTELGDELGIKTNIINIDQSIKDEFYGKTGKILLEYLSVTKDPDALTVAVMDDIDLLTSNRENAQGADNDVNNVLMQYLDGAFTLRRGNVINFAASNRPAGLDDAMRNRFNDRVLIDGPTTSEDFADMLHIMGGRLMENDLLVIENGHGYIPFETQEIGSQSSENVMSYMAEEFLKYKKSTVIDFGNFMMDLKNKNPKITGRSVKAIMEAIKERSADFDIPEKWFSMRSIFFEQPYEKKIKLLNERYEKITPDILFQEGRRYFDSEQRFANTEESGHVTRGYNNLTWEIQSQIQYYENQIKLGSGSDFIKLQTLKETAKHLAAKKVKIIIGALNSALREE